MKKGVPVATFDNEEPDSFAHWSPITGDKVGNTIWLLGIIDILK